MFELFETLLLGEAIKEEKNSKLELMGNYGFYVEPSIIGFQGYHTSTVVLTVYEDHSKSNPLEFDVKWSKILKNEPFDMENYIEKHYHITPSDIDLKIRAAISCKDAKYPGVAYLYVGPIDLDKSLLPELEGMMLNQRSSFKVRVVAKGNKTLKYNDSVVRIDKPYLTVTFDPTLEDMALTNSEATAFLPVEINFEADSSIKVRTDNYSTTNVILSYRDDAGVDNRLVIQFDSRDRRDIFYILLRLLRSIKTTFLDKLFSEYDSLIEAPWGLIHHEMGDEEDDPEAEFGFYEVARHDSIREHLRTLLRVKHDLSMENMALSDSLSVMEDDLNHSAKQFRALLDEGRTGKPKNLARYDKSRSALGELSFSILDDIKKGNKKGTREPANPDISKNAAEELKKLKETNMLLKRELEAMKKGTSVKASPIGDHSLLVVSS